MRYSVVLSISKTHLLTRKKQSIIAALGVTLGIGIYIIMMSFMTGMNSLLDGLILNRTPHIHVFNEIKQSKLQPVEKDNSYFGMQKIIHSIKPKDSKENIRNVYPLIEFLESNKNVRSVTPQMKAQVFFVAGSTRLNGVATGVDVEQEMAEYKMNDYIVNGDAGKLDIIENGIVLGIGLAEKLSLQVGENVQVRTIKGDVTSLKVVGFYQSGLADLDKVQSFVNIKTAQRLMGVSRDYITDVNVKLFDMTKAPDLAKQISKNFEVEAIDIQTANAQFEIGTSIRSMISYAVSITLLIVAGFGIYNILNMLIYEKMNDIAILKATGFSARDIRRIFISQALIIGFIGGIIGLILGLSVSLLISHAPFETEALPTIKTFPVNFGIRFYLIGIVFALLSTFFAGYFPSKRAGKIDPVEIIRGQ